MSSILREYCEILERSATGTNDVETGRRLDNPHISYEDATADKVIAKLKNVDSARYTKLGRNLKLMEKLSETMEELRKQTKQDARELVADLFDAQDACKTRVVETVGFAFKLTKDPKAAETIKYAKVLDELEGHLTPELVAIMNSLVEKHKTINAPKSPALSYDDLGESVQLDEGLMEKLKGFLSKLKSVVMSKLNGYDQKLDSLMKEVGMAGK